MFPFSESQNVSHLVSLQINYTSKFASTGRSRSNYGEVLAKYGKVKIIHGKVKVKHGKVKFMR
jgi:hypothetical protein